MEYTFLASYIVMLIGFLIMDNPESQYNVRQFLRGSNFADMVELLRKFFNFMNLTASVGYFNSIIAWRVAFILRNHRQGYKLFIF